MCGLPHGDATAADDRVRAELGASDTMGVAVMPRAEPAVVHLDGHLGSGQPRDTGRDGELEGRVVTLHMRGLDRRDVVQHRGERPGGHGERERLLGRGPGDAVEPDPSLATLPVMNTL